MIEFDHKTYENLLGTLQEKHQFISFEMASQHGGNFVILRHDLDYGPLCALDIARIDAGKGICATFFVMLNAQTYNLFEESEFNAAKEILKLGHHIGLHYDTSVVKTSSQLATQIAILGQLLGCKIKAVSQHNPSCSEQTNFSEIGVIDAYAPEYCRSIKYISDSVQNWRESSNFRDLQKYSRIQLLTHPIWWGRTHKPYRQIVNEFTNLKQCKVTELNQYLIQLYAEYWAKQQSIEK